MIKKLAILILLSMVFGLNSYASEQKEKKTQEVKVVKKSAIPNPYITKRQGIEMDKTTFGEQPIFKLEIKAVNTEITVLINGVEVYRDFSRSQVFMEYTINDYLISGDNTIDVKLLADNQLHPNAQCKVTLNVYSSELDETYNLNKIVYKHGDKEQLGESTPFGSYKFDRGLKSDLNGSIFVDRVTTEPITIYRRGKAKGIKLQQKFYLTNPFPRWKFLDSEDILSESYDNLSAEAHKELKESKKIQALYALDRKIREAAKGRDRAFLKKLFKERSDENAKAFYYDAHSNLDGFVSSLINTVNNPHNELIERSEKDNYFVVEENRKLAKIRPIAIKDNETGLYHRYNIQYRYKDGEWMVTK